MKVSALIDSANATVDAALARAKEIEALSTSEADAVFKSGEQKAVDIITKANTDAKDIRARAASDAVAVAKNVKSAEQTLKAVEATIAQRKAELEELNKTIAELKRRFA